MTSLHGPMEVVLFGFHLEVGEHLEVRDTRRGVRYRPGDDAGLLGLSDHVSDVLREEILPRTRPDDRIVLVQTLLINRVNKLQ